MSAEITIKNIRACRKFGFGYSYTPTGHGTEIEAPAHPEHTGTLKQIESALGSDLLLKNERAFRADAWFYDGKRIESVYRFGMIKPGPSDPDDLEAFYDKAEYDNAWFAFDPEKIDGDTVKIRIAD
jgi:hypothetical protein